VTQRRVRGKHKVSRGRCPSDMAPAILRPVAVHGKEMACLGLQEGCSGASLAGGKHPATKFPGKSMRRDSLALKAPKEEFLGGQ
jgi:hypothetical protein